MLRRFRSERTITADIIAALGLKPVKTPKTDKKASKRYYIEAVKVYELYSKIVESANAQAAKFWQERCLKLQDELKAARKQLLAKEHDCALIAGKLQRLENTSKGIGEDEKISVYSKRGSAIKR